MSKKIKSSFFQSKWKLTLKVLPIIAFLLLLKYITHEYDLEFLSLNSLFTAIISANIFLVGFLLSGTLSDYKESEKLPSDLAASLLTMADEGLIIHERTKSSFASEYINQIIKLNVGIVEWFHGKLSISEVFEDIKYFNKYFSEFEALTQANFIVRLKQEQNTIRKVINRIETIRNTSFLKSGYAITEIITTILVVGLLFIRIEPFHESIFFISFVSFILIYMIFFIKDLDDPFEYRENIISPNEISLEPLENSQEILNGYKKSLDSSTKQD